MTRPDQEEIYRDALRIIEKEHHIDVDKYIKIAERELWDCYRDDQESKFGD